MIYTVTFNPAVDYVLRLSTLSRGGINRTLSEEICWGGKGINVSTVLKMLGTNSTALGFTAGFTGEALENAVKSMGIDCDFIRLEKGVTRICVKLFETESSEETEINPGGPEIDGQAIDKLLHQLDRLSCGDILVLAGSVPRSVPNDIYEIICKRLENSGVLIAADASGELLTKLLKYKPFLVKPNHHEVGEIFGCQIFNADQAEACALQLRVMGAANVIVSMAEMGAVLAAEDSNVYRIGSPKGTAVNSVGAGDSMLAGFLAGYLRTNSFYEALKWGTAAGSATAFSKGLADRDTFDRLLKEISQ
ncbi:MAG: 1-phosphofructokinase [Huintestinicola sp.]|uniref:1-phosphofructokinase n=1 Tax=Huintestinicola sp. TaxID=2981661 RepID=UPI003F03E548